MNLLRLHHLRDVTHLKHKVVDILPSTMNNVRGTAIRTGQVPDLGRPPTVRRDTFEDILADTEVPTTPQRQVQFTDVATSTPIPRPMEHQVEGILQVNASQVPLYSQGLFDSPDPCKNLYKEGFTHSSSHGI